MIVKILAVMVAATLAQHLGLLEAVAKVVAKVVEKVAGCSMCSTFWACMAVSVYMGEDLVLSFLFAIVAAYLSAWLGLLLILLQRLYNESWERLRKRSKPKK